MAHDVTHEARSDLSDGQHDVVALLMRQHGDIRTLFEEVERTAGEERRESFRRLVRLLAIHETAEEEVVHPGARTLFDGAAEVVDERLREEHAAKERLSRMEGMDPDDPAFPVELQKLREEVEHHARAEERYEFPHLRRHASPEQLSAMARAVTAAEAMAPTHPHPGMEPASANIALGPLAAVADRTRDAIHQAMKKRS